MMAQESPIRVGSRVYLKNAICGFPGCVIGFERGRAVVYWDDLDMGRNTAHTLDTLVIDEAFKCEQLGLAVDQEAA